MPQAETNQQNNQGRRELDISLTMLEDSLVRRLRAKYQWQTWRQSRESHKLSSLSKFTYNSTLHPIEMAKLLNDGYCTRFTIVSQYMHLILQVPLQGDWKSCHASHCSWAWISGSSQPLSTGVWRQYITSKARLGKEEMWCLLGGHNDSRWWNWEKKVDVFLLYCSVVHILE